VVELANNLEAKMHANKGKLAKTDYSK